MITRKINLLVLIPGVLLLACCDLSKFEPPVISHGYVETDGLARGVAIQDLYAYLADGDEGLRIFNISNPGLVNQEGVVDLPGFNERVAVYGDMALVTDASQNCVYIVDIFNKSKPLLKWTYKTLAIPRAVTVDGGIAYLAVRGDNPQASSYFSGIEAITCSLSSGPASLQSVAVAKVTDIATTTTHVYTLSENQLTAFPRTLNGFTPTPTSTLKFSSNELLQSIDSRAENLLLVLGLNLYLVDVKNPAQPVVADQKLVEGYGHQRTISSAVPSASGSGTSDILFSIFIYSTLNEYGTGLIELNSKKIAYLAEALDLEKESDGEIKLYEVEMRKEYWTKNLLDSGDVLAVGAIDQYGLGFAWRKKKP